MSRHENEDLTNLDIPGPIEYVKKQYNIEGKPCLPGETSFAKQIYSPETKVSTYYILFENERPLNVRDFNSKNLKFTRFRKVSEIAYSLYLRFLKDKRQSFYHQAQREI